MPHQPDKASNNVEEPAEGTESRGAGVPVVGFLLSPDTVFLVAERDRYRVNQGEGLLDGGARGQVRIRDGALPVGENDVAESQSDG